MVHQKYLTYILALGALLAAGPGPALAYPGQDLAKDAGISMEQARASALKAAPGRVTAERLEKAGDGGLRYSFDIRDGKGMREVDVDARTGAILDNIIEGTHPG